MINFIVYSKQEFLIILNQEQGLCTSGKYTVKKYLKFLGGYVCIYKRSIVLKT